MFILLYKEVILWDLWGLRFDRIFWTLFGNCLGLLWDVCGNCLGLLWDVCGNCLGFWVLLDTFRYFKVVVGSFLYIQIIVITFGHV